MKKLVITCLILTSTWVCYGQAKVITEDLKSLIGDWEGSITYLDYQTSKPFTMAAHLVVKPLKNENTLELNHIYPKEPEANSTSKIKVTREGTYLNKKPVTSRAELEGGLVQIQTEHKGKDDNKDAVIRYTYTLGAETFVNRKEVQFEASDDWIKRNEFEYRRKE